MLMAESLALNLLFRAVRPRAPRHRTNGWIHRSRALRRPLEFPDALLGARPAGSRKSTSGCHQPSAQVGNNLINLINVFKLISLLPLLPLVPRRVVHALK